MRKTNLKGYVAPECEQYTIQKESIVAASSGTLYLYQDSWGEEDF